MTDKSNWKLIEGASQYFVNEAGEIRGPGRHGGAAVLKPRRTSNGYLKVSIWRDDGSVWTALVHRLVASQFLPKPNGMTQVNHKDGNKQNNNAANLEWCSPTENTDHAKKMGLYLKGEAASLAKLNQEQVSEIWRALTVGEKSSSLARRFGVKPATIADIKQGRSWSWLTSGF